MNQSDWKEMHELAMEQLLRVQKENAELRAKLFKAEVERGVMIDAYDELKERYEENEASNKAVELELEDVPYKGSFADGVRYLKAKLSAQDLQVMYLEKRLDAWDRQPIVGWIDKEDKRRLLPETPMGEDEEFFEPLFTKPKEA